jgi:hypothetical protein
MGAAVQIYKVMIAPIDKVQMSGPWPQVLSPALAVGVVALEEEGKGLDGDRARLPLRRLTGLRSLNDMFESRHTFEPEATYEGLSVAMGTALGLSVKEGLEMIGVDSALLEMPGGEENTPAALQLMYRGTKTPEGPAAARGYEVAGQVQADRYFGALYANRKCATCGIIPKEFAKTYAFCSACGDPKAGRFCCKDPCFVAFWKGGHKNECAGRHKLKEAKKKAKEAAGGVEAGSSGGK